MKSEIVPSRSLSTTTLRRLRQVAVGSVLIAWATSTVGQAPLRSADPASKSPGYNAPPVTAKRYPQPGECYQISGKPFCIPQSPTSVREPDSSICGAVNGKRMCVPSKAVARLPKPGDCAPFKGSVYCLPDSKFVSDEERTALLAKYMNK
jgi:hypothetical protein